MAKARPTPGQLNLFSAEQWPASRPAPTPPPRRVADTVTEQLPAALVAAGWRIVWRTEKYDDGWFYAVNDRTGQRTADHIYVKHRGFKYAVLDITKGQTTPITLEKTP